VHNVIAAAMRTRKGDMISQCVCALEDGTGRLSSTFIKQLKTYTMLASHKSKDLVKYVLI